MQTTVAECDETAFAVAPSSRLAAPHAACSLALAPPVAQP